MRRLDATGALLLIGVAAAVCGGGALLVRFSIANAWELVAIVIVGGILVAAAHPHARATGPRNTNIHGAARPANEAEALAAARGTSKAADLHEHKFSD